MSKKNKRNNNKTREPLRYDPPFDEEELEEEKPRPRYRTKMVYLIDRDEVNRLINASLAEYVEPPSPQVNTYYPTYSREECTTLIVACSYPEVLYPNQDPTIGGSNVEENTDVSDSDITDSDDAVQGSSR